MDDPVGMGGGQPRLLIRTVKAVAAAGLLTFLAAHVITNGFERGGATRLAAAIRAPVPDPATTGSIGGSAANAARTTRLDPCVMPRR